MKSMREDSKAVERLRKTAKQLSRQEGTSLTTVGRSGKGYRVLAYPCQVRRVSRHTFAYRKTAERFPHTAADCLFAEQVAVCAGAGQRQHRT